MKTMYENLDKLDIYTWHRDTKQYFKDILCGYLYYYQRVYTFLKGSNIVGGWVAGWVWVRGRVWVGLGGWRTLSDTLHPFRCFDLMRFQS